MANEFITRNGFISLDTSQITGSLLVNGSIGIGTTSPNSNLEIRSDNATAYDPTADNGQDDAGTTLTIRNANITTNSFSQVDMQVSGDTGRAVGRIVTIRRDSATSDMAFVTENANTKAEKMRITSEGNVGIGTTNPTTKLDIEGGANLLELTRTSVRTYMHQISGGGDYIIRDITGDSDRITLNTNGNVGIGSTVPGNRLDVNGNINVPSTNFFRYEGDTGLIGSGTSITGGTSTQLGIRAANDILFATNGANERMRISSAGNVGIGTTSPNNLLTLYNASSAIYSQWVQSGTGTGSTDGLRIGLDASSNGIINLNEGTSLITSVDGSERMRITSGGNVGIGVTSPTATLDIGSARTLSGTDPISVYTDTRVQSGVTGGLIGYNVRMVGLSPAVGSYTIANMYAIKTNTPVVQPNVTVTNSYGVYIGRTDDPSSGGVVTNKYALVTEATAGNVGIGTTTPTYTLDVFNSTEANLRVKTSSTTGLAGLYIGNGNRDYSIITRNSVSNVLEFRNETANNTVMAISGSNVGIGTTSPAFPLTIYNSNAATVYQTAGTGTGGGNGFYVGHTSNISYVWNYNNFPLVLATNNTERVRIAADGNVGIGTTSPSYPLHAVSGSELTNPESNMGVYYAFNNSSTTLNTGAALGFGSNNNLGVILVAQRTGANNEHALKIQTRNSAGSAGTRMTIQGDGNVGIGTTSPGAILTVRGSNNSYGSGIRWQNTSSGNNFEAIHGSSDTLYWGYNGNTFLQMVTNTAFNIIAGNVGIGTTNPGLLLDIKFDSSSTDITGSGASSLRLLNQQAANTNNFHTGIWFRLDNGINNKNGYIKLVNDATNAVGDFAFILTQSGNEFERLRIKGNGNVGIGSTAPAYALDVNGTTRTTGNTILASSGNYVSIGGAPFYAGTSVGSLSIRGDLYPGIAFYTGSAGGDLVGQIFSYAGTGNIILNADPNNANSATTIQFHIDDSFKMLINSNGNVGIGTTNPSQKLTVLDSNDAEGLGVYRNFSAASDAGTYIRMGALNGSSTLTPGAAILGVLEAAKTSGYLTFLTYTGSTATERVRITSAGNIGIGTTSPSQLVEIQKDQAATTTLLVRNVNDQTNAATEIRLYGNQQSDSISNNQQISFVRGSAGVDWAIGQPANSTAFVIAGGTNQGDGKPSLGTAERMRITNDGNVGIGTTNPLTILNVASTAPVIRLNPTTQNNVTAIEFGVLNAGTNAYAKIDAINEVNFDTNLRFYTNAAGSTTQVERMRISRDGNVGIGTTSPSAIAGALAVNMYAGSGIRSSFVVESNAGANFAVLGSGLSSADLGVLYYNLGMRFGSATNKDATGFSEAMRITSGGNVGIGTTSPNEYSGYTFLTINNNTTGAGLDLEVAGTRTATINTTSTLTDIGTTTNIPLAFYTNGTEKMRIAAGGNVGIGTTSPAARLQVSGSNNVLNVRGSGSAATPSLFSVDGASGRLFDVTDTLSGSLFSVNTAAGLPVIEAFSDNTVRLGTFSALTGATMNITGSNVGIGTTGPTSKLHVVGSSLTDTFRITDGSNYTIVMGYLGSGNTGLISTLGGTAALSLGTNSTERLTILGGGSVGIGTTNPGATLSIYNSAASNASGQETLRIMGSYSAGTPGSGPTIQFTDSSGGATGAIKSMHESTSANVGLGFFTLSTTLQQRLTILANGSVGINSTSPGSRLDVGGQTRTNTVYFRNLSGASNVGFIGGYSDWTGGSTDNNMAIGTYQPTMAFFTNNDTTERMRITSVGEVWMGYTSDQGAYLLQVNGSVYATSYFESSDIRLKDVISSKKSSTFGAIEYKWKDKKDDKVHWGYSAQDVMKWIPDALKQNNDGYYTLDYHQAHTYKIATLEERIAELEQQIKQLKNS